MATLTKTKISPCLWFDHQAEQAVAFYTGIFPNSRTLLTNHYTEAGREIHGQKPGSVMSILFELDGQQFAAMNAGPVFQFNEAVSLMIGCESQEEIDFYWDRLCQGGTPSQCGWLKDRYGLSWQVTPTRLFEMLHSEDRAAATRAMAAMMKQRKLDLGALEQAFQGA